MTLQLKFASQATSLAERAMSLDARSRIIDDSSRFDDAVVLFGLAASGRVKAEWLRQRLAEEERLETIIQRGLASQTLPSSSWAELQQLWYRLRVPLGVASLPWWYLFCLAYERTQNMPAACDLAAAWVEAIAAADPAQRVSVYRERIGLSEERGVVAIRDDVASLECLAAAAASALPLIPIASGEELAALRRSGVTVLAPDLERGAPNESLRNTARLPRPGRPVASLRDLCPGRTIPVGSASSEMRAFWIDMPSDERTFVLIHLEQNIAALEIVRFSHGNELFDNPRLAELVGLCRSRDPRDWSYWELVVASVLWAWSQAGFMVHELNQSEVTLHGFRFFLEQKVATYCRLVGSTFPTDLTLPELAVRFAGLRKQVDRSYQRCIYFDGGNFERREFILAKEDIRRAHALPASLRSAMEERFGVAMPDAGPVDSWKQYLGLLIERGSSPTDLMIALAEWAADAPDVPVDIAIFDVPRGLKLDKPWELEWHEVFCVTAFRSDWDMKRAGLPLNAIGVRNAIGQRMRYNAVKKAQNYALVKKTTPQSFLLPDIAVGEDANHGGHFASGIRHACRVPIAIHYRGNEWKGIADVRLSRTDYSYANRFREEDLRIASRYGVWAKAIADETYARDLLFDERYCINLDDGRDVVARLGRAPKRGKT